MTSSKDVTTAGKYGWGSTTFKLAHMTSDNRIVEFWESTEFKTKEEALAYAETQSFINWCKSTGNTDNWIVTRNTHAELEVAKIPTIK